jgi:hypothetical protein
MIGLGGHPALASACHTDDIESAVFNHVPERFKQAPVLQ